MNDQDLRRYCTQVIQQLDIPDPFDINVLVDRLEQQRGREISLLPMELPTGRGPCGLWVATDEVDYVLYQQNTTKAHQRHIALHELGHMLCGHKSTPAHQEEISQLLMPTLAPSLVRMVLGRTGYDRTEEKAAELVASLIPLQTSSTMPQQPSIQPPPDMAVLISHLERSLERGTPRRT
ncbi:hypothetical protein FE633_11265 [Streptomyces montanus]|uniref:ImmA/IrrE family metallo-endopeptidase n=1 Tax=Streptomyces montanus TaxID=2580423 RepID=A0A5R9FVW7_9ACTN|nr:hypothetical protein [Streptomyces montanus]TLS46116.1 hypothetical protein FE633_11265 [Streptomyces montanus]